MKRIALTGGIACGKSLLSRYLTELGVEVIDADEVVHELIPADERARLAKEVFADAAKRRALEARIHPLVKARIDEFFAADAGDFAGPSADPPIRMAAVPLLFEVQWERNFDIICTIVSERPVQIERMMTTRGYSRDEAEARLAAQLPNEEKAARADYVIRNDGSPEQLNEEARKFLSWLKTSMCSPT